MTKIGNSAWARASLGLAVAVALGTAACGGDDVTTTGGTSAGDAIGGAEAGSLQDGWQSVADVAPPDDSWAWNPDAGRWQQGDAAASDTTPLSDSTVADGEAAPDTTASDGSVSSDSAGSDDVSDGGADLPPPEPGTLGQACATQKNCKTGLFCAGAGTPYGYCAKAGCTTSADCAAQSDEPLCCVEYQGKNYCLKQFGASQCGVQDKAPGESCLSGGQSDCQTFNGDWCLKQGKQAICVQGCSQAALSCPTGTTCVLGEGGGGGCLPYTEGVKDGSPCAGKNIGGCGKAAFCIENYPGDPYAYCASQCTLDADCDPGFACSPYGPGQGVCIQAGSTPAGSSCADDRFSCAKGLICLGGQSATAVCSPLCSSDSQCQKALGGQAYCWKGPGSQVGACYPAGDKQNGDNCSKDPYACGPGQYCIGGYDGYNPDAFCQKTCGLATDGSCPAGSQCVQYTPTYSGCQVQGSKGQGETCAGAPTSCKVGHLCIGPQGKEVCAQQCTPGTSGACGSGLWCLAWGSQGLGICVPAGSQTLGQTCAGQAFSCASGTFCQNWGQTAHATCIAPCPASGACPGGTDCKDFGEAGKFCMPAGGKLQGESCVGAAGSCAAGHVCLHAQSSYATCVEQCGKDSDCASGHWCNLGKWGGYCLPDGKVAKNGSCFNQPFACAKGLTCIGNAFDNPGAFCAQECSGFASTCATGEKCQFLGGGGAWCFPTGKLPHGSSCMDASQSCDPSTLCIKGSPAPTCLQVCGVGKPACPKDSPCTYFVGSALALCVPAGFQPFGAITAPF